MQAGRLETDLAGAVEGLKAARTRHMGYDYYNFASIKVAEFLYVEIFHTVPLSEWRELRDDGSTENPGLILNFYLRKIVYLPVRLRDESLIQHPETTGVDCAILYDVSLLRKKRIWNSSMRDWVCQR